MQSESDTPWSLILVAPPDVDRLLDIGELCALWLLRIPELLIIESPTEELLEDFHIILLLELSLPSIRHFRKRCLLYTSDAADE